MSNSKEIVTNGDESSTVKLKAELKNILELYDYMCFQCKKKSEVLIDQEPTDTVKEMSEKINCLLNRMETNLGHFKNMYKEAIAEYKKNKLDKNAEQDANVVVTPQKKKFNLGLKKQNDTKETDMELTPKSASTSYDNEEDNALKDGQLQLDDNSSDSSDDSDTGSIPPLGQFEIEQNMELCQQLDLIEDCPAVISNSRVETAEKIVSSDQFESVNDAIEIESDKMAPKEEISYSENFDFDGDEDDTEENEERVREENNELLSLLDKRTGSHCEKQILTPNEAELALDVMNKDDSDEEMDQANELNEQTSDTTDIDTSLCTPDSDDGLSSGDDISDSDTSSSSSNFSVIHFPKNHRRRVIQSSSDEETNKEEFDEAIKIEKLKSECLSNSSVRIPRIDEMSDNEINRLCDLNNLDKKHCSSVINRRKKKCKRRKTSNESPPSPLSTSSSSASSRATTPDLQDIVMEETLPSEFDPNKQIQLAADVLLNNLPSPDISSDSDSDTVIEEYSQDSVNKPQSTDEHEKNAGGEGPKNSTEITNGQISNPDKLWSDSELEESEVIEINDEPDEPSNTKIKRASWKNDPLLCRKLSTDSESDNKDTIKLEIKRVRRCSTSTECSQIVVLDSDDSSDEDSTDDEIEVISNEISDDSDIECLDDMAQLKGRKNIRRIMEDKELAAETQRAKNTEDERIHRLERHKRTLDHIQSQHKEFVLDVDEETKRPVVTVEQDLADQLKPHQREGVKFMWEACYESVQMLKKGNQGSGCILAHCMGLGKTRQVITLIHTVFEHKVTNTRHVLVIAPLSTVTNWKNEFDLAYDILGQNPKFSLFFILTGNTNKKYDRVCDWKRHGGVIVMSYETFTILSSEPKSDIKKKLTPQQKQDMIQALVDPGPDLVICDEGHLIKNNKTLRYQAVIKIKTKRRIILTGTPLQNNLMEYYHMVQFIKPNLLGTKDEYVNRFNDPIMNGQYFDSTEGDKILMKKRTHCLGKLLKKTVHRVESKVLEDYLPPIFDYTIYIKLTPTQIDMYKKLIDSIKSSNVGGRDAQFFTHFRLTKYITLHPYVLHYSYVEYPHKKKKKRRAKASVIQLDDIENVEEDVSQAKLAKDWYLEFYPQDALNNIDYGSKLKVVLAILEEASKIGDKTLLFSSSLAEFDVIEHFLTVQGTPSCPTWHIGVDYFRLDGDVNADRRQGICDKFNDPKNKSVKLFMVTHQVGGLGLNLTAANRVILIGTNFNPCNDTQSIYRAFRFGQKKSVYVYRLVSEGTMEGLIYEKCVIKLGVAVTVVDNCHIARHFRSTNRDEYYKYHFDDYNQERPPLPQPTDQLLADIIERHEDIFKFLEHRSLLKHMPEEELDDALKQVAEDELDKEINDHRNASVALIVPQPPLLYPERPVLHFNMPNSLHFDPRVRMYTPQFYDFSRGRIQAVNPMMRQPGGPYPVPGNNPVQGNNSNIPHTRSFSNAPRMMPTIPSSMRDFNRPHLVNVPQFRNFRLTEPRHRFQSVRQPPPDLTRRVAQNHIPRYQDNRVIRGDPRVPPPPIQQNQLSFRDNRNLAYQRIGDETTVRRGEQRNSNATINTSSGIADSVQNFFSQINVSTNGINNVENRTSSANGGETSSSAAGEFNYSLNKFI